MLTEAERQEIDAVVEKYETKTAASVEALRIVQRGRGWVSDRGSRRSGRAPRHLGFVSG